MPLPASPILHAGPFAAEPGAAERQALYETQDAPASAGTPYTIALGDSFTGRLNGDTDWVRVHLEAGATYVIDLAGTGPSPVGDTVLNLRAGTGEFMATDDDSGPGLDARLTFTATTSGVHYIEIGS